MGPFFFRFGQEVVTFYFVSYGDGMAPGGTTLIYDRVDKDRPQFHVSAHSKPHSAHSSLVTTYIMEAAKKALLVKVHNWDYCTLENESPNGLVFDPWRSRSKKEPVGFYPGATGDTVGFVKLWEFSDKDATFSDKFTVVPKEPSTNLRHYVEISAVTWHYFQKKHSITSLVAKLNGSPGKEPAYDKFLLDRGKKVMEDVCIRLEREHLTP
jgi:hypothetical protein